MPQLEASATTPALRSGLAERLRKSGLWATLQKAWGDHVLRYSTSVIVEYRADWESSLGKAATHPEWLSFCMVRNTADLPPLSNWLAWRHKDFESMLANGKVGVFALDSGTAISCMWLSLTDHQDTKSREFYPVREREAYHYCWLTDPESRRRNVTLPLCRYFLSNLDLLGIDKAFGVVDRVNRASYMVQLHFGYRERGVKVVHLMVLKQRFTFVSQYDGVLGTTAPKDRKMPRG